MTSRPAAATAIAMVSRTAGSVPAAPVRSGSTQTAAIAVKCSPTIARANRAKATILSSALAPRAARRTAIAEKTMDITIEAAT